MKKRLYVLRLSAVVLALVLPSQQSAAEEPGVSQLRAAEQFIDAFYAFDPGPLADILAGAGESQQDILFYQGWAEGGNYIVIKRYPCQAAGGGVVSCSITVQDDLVLALGIAFDVTDTFTITFEGASIVSVETSSNDPQLYHDARKWVREQRKELVEESCELEPNPDRCVRGMLTGYREYAKLKGLEARPLR